MYIQRVVFNMSQLQSLSVCTRRFKQSEYLEEVGKYGLPSYFPESHLALADYVFRRSRKMDDLYIIVRDAAGTLKIRLFIDNGSVQNGMLLYAGTGNMQNDLEDVIRFLTSKYFHTPNLSMSTSFVGYHPETGLTYTLKGSVVNSEDPSERGPFSFRDYARVVDRRPDVDFEPQLQAIIGPLKKSASPTYAYVYSDVAIKVNAEHNQNRVIPLVYDGAWRDFIDRIDGDLITAENEYATEVFVEEV